MKQYLLLYKYIDYKKQIKGILLNYPIRIDKILKNVLLVFYCNL
jgi:hypothetical protein